MSKATKRTLLVAVAATVIGGLIVNALTARYPRL
jgi:hypothetical protein